MAQQIPKELMDKVKKLGSEVRFSVQVIERKDPKNLPVIDPATNRPFFDQVQRADLVAGNQIWCTGQGGDKIAALADALSKSDTAKRPASTAQEVIRERDVLKEANAKLQAELDQLRAASAQAPAPGTSQRRRGAQAEEPAEAAAA
jgi:hypothetical protein